MVIQGRSSCPFGEGALPATPRNSFPFRRLCEALVRVGHRVRSRKVARLQLCDLKTCRCDDLVNLPIEVAAAPNSHPHGRYPILPGGYAGIGSAAMLEKDETPALPQDSLHLLKCL